MKQPNRSPLKDRPLRNPGESLADQQLDLLFEEILLPMFMAIMMAYIAVVEWVRYFLPFKPNPVFITVIASIIVAYAARRIWKAWPYARRLRLAIHGEKAVGQFLERLRADGYHVFHDVLGPEFNIDHVVIGPAGAFTIETKTRSKPTRGRATISFDGEQILVAGIAPDRNPVSQARAQAAWLRKLLADSTGKQFPVRPVVVFPGWYVERVGMAKSDIWVLEPKALPHFLGSEPVKLEESDHQMAAFHLSRFIRSEERRRPTGKRSSILLDA